MIEIFLVISLILNILQGWYIYQLVRRFLYVSEGLDTFFGTLEEFSEHLKRINKMETYYGDSTLQNLVNHSQDIVKLSEEIRMLYDNDYVPPEEIDEDEAAV